MGLWLAAKARGTRQIFLVVCEHCRWSKTTVPASLHAEGGGSGLSCNDKIAGGFEPDDLHVPKSGLCQKGSIFPLASLTRFRFAHYQQVQRHQHAEPASGIIVIQDAFTYQKHTLRGQGLKTLAEDCAAVIIIPVVQDPTQDDRVSP